jgi:hypothetical protein
MAIIDIPSLITLSTLVKNILNRSGTFLPHCISNEMAPIAHLQLKITLLNNAVGFKGSELGGIFFIIGRNIPLYFPAASFLSAQSKSSIHFGALTLFLLQI